MERIDVHGYGPHESCPDPARCDCECRGCKRAWFVAGRPNPAAPDAPNVFPCTPAEPFRSLTFWTRDTTGEIRERATLVLSALEAAGVDFNKASPDAEHTFTLGELVGLCAAASCAHTCAIGIAAPSAPPKSPAHAPWFTAEQAQARAELFEALGVTGATGPAGEPWGPKSEPQPSETEEALLAKYG